MTHKVRRLQTLVSFAVRSVPFYRIFYAGRVHRLRNVHDFTDLPVLTEDVLTTEVVVHTLSDPTGICMTRSCEESAHSSLIMPRLLSYEDAVGEFRVLAFLLKQTPVRGHQRVALIGELGYAYTLGEITRHLAIYRWSVMACFTSSSFSTRRTAAHLTAMLSMFNPSVLFVFGVRGIRLAIPPSVRHVFTFQSGDTRSLLLPGPISVWDILRHPRVGLIGIRPVSERQYVYDPRAFYCESESDGTLLVTCLRSHLQPLIRYRTGVRGHVTTEGRIDLGHS
jgi:phenylacetate-coenzyme A ligase PaaK-like adenylate-forming protein